MPGTTTSRDRWPGHGPRWVLRGTPEADRLLAVGVLPVVGTVPGGHCWVAMLRTTAADTRVPMVRLLFAAEDCRWEAADRLAHHTGDVRVPDLLLPRQWRRRLHGAATAPGSHTTWLSVRDSRRLTRAAADPGSNGPSVALPPAPPLRDLVQQLHTPSET